MRVATWCALGGAFVAFAAAWLFVLLSTPSWHDVHIALAIACVSLALFLTALTLRGIQVFRRLRDERGVRDADDIDEIIGKSHGLYAQVSFDAAVAFSGALLRPQSYIQRITESVDLQQGHVVVASTYTIDSALYIARGAQYFPVELIERGVLADGLELTDNNAKRVSSVIRLTATSYLLAVCRRLIDEAGGEKLLVEYEETVERGVAEVIGSHAPIDALAFLETVAALTSQADRAGEGSKYVYEVIGMLFLLRPWYPLLVDARSWSKSGGTASDQDATDNVATSRLDASAIPLASYTRFRVAQNRILRRRLFDNWAGVRSVYSNARLLLLLIFGVYNNDVLVPLDNAERALSYHLQTNGIEGTYVGDQGLERRRDGLRAGESYQIKPRQGQNYSRLYVSSGRSFRGRTFQTWFFETPPGSVGIATGVAFASLFGLALLAVSQLRWISGGQLNAFTLLLGFPGAILGFLGLGKTGGFFRGSFRARVSNVISLGAALTGLACAALVERSTTLQGAALVTSDLNQLPPLLVFWSVLLAIQLFNAVLIFLIWLYRVFVYWSAATN